MSLETWRPERLDPDRHDVRAFRSGSDEVDRFLRQHAKLALRQNTSVTHVYCEQSPRGRSKRLKIAAYYSLATSAIDVGLLPVHHQESLPRHPVPAILLTWLGVDAEYRGMGLGGKALLSAASRAVATAQNIGVHLMVTDALGPAAKAFYEHFGFVAMANNPYRLFRRIEGLAKVVPSLE